MEAPELMNMREVCDCLRLSRQTVYRLCWSGVLRSMKVGGKRVVERSALWDFLRRQESVAGEVSQ